MFKIIYKSFLSAILLNFLIAKVFAIDPLYIDMREDIVIGGEEISLTAYGGTPPYFWIAETGEIKRLNSIGSQATLTAPQISGTFTVTIVDSMGDLAETKFAVQWEKFSVSPNYAYLRPEQSIRLSLHDVTDEVKVIADAGNLEWNADDQILYTAPKETGFYTLTIYQANAPLDTRLVHIKVYEPLEAKKSEFFLETYETEFLSIQGGVEPYFWIEGGKGQLSSLHGNTVHYTPGDVIGTETIQVFDSTGDVVEIAMTVKNNFQLSSLQHSLCLDVKNPENNRVKFVASGGQPPYEISPPNQDGWKMIDEITTDSTFRKSMTLEFYKGDTFEIVGSDSDGKFRISRLIVSEPPCDMCQINPSSPILSRVKWDDTFQSGVSISVEGTEGDVEWLCSSSVGDCHLSKTTGELIQFFPKAKGNYILMAFDQAGRSCEAEINVFRDLFSLYAGWDKYLDENEMSRAVNDYFNPTTYYSRSDFYYLAERFLDQEARQ